MRKVVELKKHSAVIQISNRVTSSQRKLYNVLLYLARKILSQKPQTYKFGNNIATLMSMAGIKNTNYKTLKESLVSLERINVQYNIFCKDKEIWGAFNLLAGIEIKNGTVEFSFPHQVYETLLNPSVYALLDLNIIKGLQSKYSIALYEIAKDYINASIPAMSVETFRELMGLNEGKYKNSKDLRKNVIDPAVLEISNKTDIFMCYELHRRGRKVVAIKFLVRKQQMKLFE